MSYFSHRRSINWIKYDGTQRQLSFYLNSLNFELSSVFVKRFVVQNLHEINIALSHTIFCMCLSLMWTFTLCYMGTSTTHLMSEIGDMVYNRNWYSYPTYLRQYIIMIIARSQRTIYFTGFQIVDCTLEVFTKVNWHSTNQSHDNSFSLFTDE